MLFRSGYYHRAYRFIVSVFTEIYRERSGDRIGEGLRGRIPESVSVFASDGSVVTILWEEFLAGREVSVSYRKLYQLFFDIS